jgi:hypothetical protein
VYGIENRKFEEKKEKIFIDYYIMFRAGIFVTGHVDGVLCRATEKAKRVIKTEWALGWRRVFFSSFLSVSYTIEKVWCTASSHEYYINFHKSVFFFKFQRIIFLTLRAKECEQIHDLFCFNAELEIPTRRYSSHSWAPLISLFTLKRR